MKCARGTTLIAGGQLVDGRKDVDRGGKNMDRRGRARGGSVRLRIIQSSRTIELTPWLSTDDRP